MPRMILFSKMHALGNDYIIVDESRAECIGEDEKPDFVSEVCRRRFSIGADGVIFIEPATGEGDIRFRVFNADGSEAEMCGNGIRCFAKFVYDNAIIRKRKIKVETLAGLKVVDLNIDKGVVVSARVDMGLATFKTAEIPMKSVKDEFIEEYLEVDGQNIKLTAVNVGNPHAIIFVDDLESVDLEGLGPLIENHPVFPERINVHFVEVLSPSEIDMVTWERGVGPTLACGTGATATVIAGKRIGKLDDKVLVHLPGGELKIQTYKMGNKIGAYMEGDAILVFDGILSW
ncbi:MAG: diaminopimelate epimerase [Methanobacteriaceae archaeon]|nr:diaminopimelate epimerase [Methanobacteriaceae archaeon]